MKKAPARRVKATHYGIVHIAAGCNECDWHRGDYRRPGAVRQAARSHVRTTGHSVTIEVGTSTKYHPHD